MSKEQVEVLQSLPPKVISAVTELEAIIQRQYPSASFAVSRSVDEPENVHLTAVVDVEDTDEVLDLVIDRVVQLQVEEGIPLHIIPIRTPERVLADLKARPRSVRTLPYLGRKHAGKL